MVGANRRRGTRHGRSERVEPSLETFEAHDRVLTASDVNEQVAFDLAMGKSERRTKDLETRHLLYQAMVRDCVTARMGCESGMFR
jgi:hypothetical protein